MFSNLFWILAVAGFVGQLLCCVYGKTKWVRLLPLTLMAAVMLGTVVLGCTVGDFGLIAALVLAWNEAKILAFMAVGYGLYRLVLFTKK